MVVVVSLIGLSFHKTSLNIFSKLYKISESSKKKTLENNNEIVFFRSLNLCDLYVTNNLIV